MGLANLICSYKATIKDVMMCIDKNAKGSVFVINESGRLVGVVTDGDIRRLLINGYGLNDSIKTHIREDFVYAQVSDSPADIVGKFNYRIRIIPIVDDEMQLVDYAEFDENVHISLAQPQLNGNEYKYLMDAMRFFQHGYLVQESILRFLKRNFQIIVVSSMELLHQMEQRHYIWH